MDFELLLVVGTLLTGVLWLLDHLLLLPKRKAALAQAQKQVAAQAEESGATEEAAELDDETREKLMRMPMWGDISKSLFPVLAAVLIIRSFLFEPFTIPSGSMLPTLKIGDYILVNKFDYGLRLPVINTRILPLGEPQRGDVVVFKYPKDPSTDFIKRVVGLPGDKIEYRDKVLYINGVKQEQTLEERIPPLEPQQLLINEKLGDVDHDIFLDTNTDYRIITEGSYTVPEGKYFVMGDNRDNSNDSRYWGFVPQNLLVGKAVLVWMHWPSFTSLPDFTAARRIH